MMKKIAKTMTHPKNEKSKMLGHSNLRSTQVYAVITDDKISKDMDKLMQRRQTKETDQNKNKEDGK